MVQAAPNRAGDQEGAGRIRSHAVRAAGAVADRGEENARVRREFCTGGLPSNWEPGVRLLQRQTHDVSRRQGRPHRQDRLHHLPRRRWDIALRQPVIPG